MSHSVTLPQRTFKITTSSHAKLRKCPSSVSRRKARSAAESASCRSGRRPRRQRIVLHPATCLLYTSLVLRDSTQHTTQIHLLVVLRRPRLFRRESDDIASLLIEVDRIEPVSYTHLSGSRKITPCKSATISSSALPVSRAINGRSTFARSPMLSLIHIYSKNDAHICRRRYRRRIYY